MTGRNGSAPFAKELRGSRVSGRGVGAGRVQRGSGCAQVNNFDSFQVVGVLHATPGFAAFARICQLKS